MNIDEAAAKVGARKKLAEAKKTRATMGTLTKPKKVEVTKGFKKLIPPARAPRALTTTVYNPSGEQWNKAPWD